MLTVTTATSRRPGRPGGVRRGRTRTVALGRTRQTACRRRGPGARHQERHARKAQHRRRGIRGHLPARGLRLRLRRAAARPPPASAPGRAPATPARSRRAVPIGAVLSLTGAAASYGESQQKGLELAAEELAEKEGVTYELTIEDDQTDPRQGITLFDEFVTSDVSLIIGPTLSNAALQADPIAQEAGVPVLGISNTAAGVTEIGDYIHRASLTEQAVIPQTIAKATEQFGLKKVVVMYSNDDAFTESGFEAFSGALEDEGVEVAEEITFSKADTDFRALLTQAKESEPDAIVVSAPHRGRDPAGHPGPRARHRRADHRRQRVQQPAPDGRRR